MPGCPPTFRRGRTLLKVSSRPCENTPRKIGITDAYVNEAMDLDRYKVEMEKLRQQRHELEGMSLDVERRSRQEETSRNALGQMKTFCNQVAQGLDAMGFEERQQLLRLVVERVTVEGDRVKVDTVIPADPGNGQLRNAHGEPVEPYE